MFDFLNPFKRSKPKEEPRLVVDENISSTWFYHLRMTDEVSALCGVQTLRDEKPLSDWGHKSHIKERYCKKCEDIAIERGRLQDIRTPGVEDWNLNGMCRIKGIWNVYRISEKINDRHGRVICRKCESVIDQITDEQYNLFVREYYQDRKRQRLGQAFCNRFDIRDEVLFYMSGDLEAIDRIAGQYMSE